MRWLEIHRRYRPSVLLESDFDALLGILAMVIYIYIEREREKPRNSMHTVGVRLCC